MNAAPPLKREPKIPPATLEAQASASNPQLSAWVSANAGSGKTFVLSRRVVRLLLGTNRTPGCDPAKILCLTFTNAAAAEMANRVFGILREMAFASDEDLNSKIADITGEPASADLRRRARRLFAEALETPGGLKIQTIHGFCEALLHQFPLEANVPSQFQVLDGAMQAEFMRDARHQLYLQLDRDPQGETATAIRSLLRQLGEFTFETLIDEIVGKSDALSNWLAVEGGAQPCFEALRDSSGLPDNLNRDGLLAQDMERLTLAGKSADWLASLNNEARAAGSPTDAKLANAIETYAQSKSAQEAFDALCVHLLRADDVPKADKGVATKALRENVPALTELLHETANSVAAIVDRLKLFDLLQLTRSMLGVADQLIGSYWHMKRRAGYLDFQDLITKTSELLNRGDTRFWIQYKLDHGIDHVLVDEAQDTSPQQWAIVNALTEDFFSGLSARTNTRTVFAVGDEKQSIYSFQGARPEMFDRQRQRVQDSARHSDRQFKALQLNLSFRSVADVLEAVDDVFANPQNSTGLSSSGEKTVHESLRESDSGFVDIWPSLPTTPASLPDDWLLPLDHVVPDHPSLVLARRIALQISHWLKDNDRLAASDGPIKPGDILILVRKRDRFFDALNTELKRLDVPVAGSDRLRLGEHIIVDDLLALARFALLPHDDLSLAAALKSPLFGLSEDELYDLCADRGDETLFQSILEAAKQSHPHKPLAERLTTYVGLAREVSVYDFFAAVLVEAEGRTKFIQQFGNEAQDVLDGFIVEAIQFDRGPRASLQAFVEQMAATSLDIKREFDTNQNEVRIMTVHAAKGLEAPIVFLVDSGAPPYTARHLPKLIERTAAVDEFEQSTVEEFIVLPNKKMADSSLSKSLEAIEAAACEEYQRLLYVAMTRAADRLILCGYHPREVQNERAWHQIISDALIPQSEELPAFDGDGEIWRYRKTPRGVVDTQSAKTPVAETALPLPDWVQNLTPVGLSARSRSDGTQSAVQSPQPMPDAAIGSPNSEAARRGEAVHALLQLLPETMPSDQMALETTARQLLEQGFSDLSPEVGEDVLDEFLDVVQSDTLKKLLALGQSRAEVEIGALDDEASVATNASDLKMARIDRLIVNGDDLWIVDFKTDRFPPTDAAQIPHRYRDQLNRYKHLIGKIFPEKTIHPLIYWTHSNSLSFVDQNASLPEV
ncbi:MAG: double-strand break repair helicase AddA [Pseudomonadota bacterium]